MGTDVAFVATHLPDFARNTEASDLSKHLAGSGGGFSKRISIKGGVFRLYDAGKEIARIDDRHLDVVIVAAAQKVARQYYVGAYKEDEVTAPVCWSADGEKPDDAVKHKQATACADCPQNVKDSGAQPGSRACRYNQRLAVVLAGDIQGQVLQLQLPAQSLFGKGEGDNRPLQAYARFLATNKINPEMVVTRMRFDTAAAVPKLFFSPVRWLTSIEYEKVLEQGKTDDARDAVTMSVFQVDTSTPAPVLAGEKPVAQEVRSTTDDTPEPAPAAEPVKREKQSGAPVTPKKALDQLVSQWLSDE